ncbi:MAG: hypothetical protein Q9178_000197 [Gyalolechia marmorata]
MIFPNHKKLYKHLRSAIGPGHRALRAIINQTDCHACNREFNKPQALAIHEASSHSCEKEGGNRLEKHAPFFGSRSLPNLTAEDPHQHSHQCDDWAKAFGTLVQNKDTEGLHSLFATTTLKDQPERAKTDVGEYDDWNIDRKLESGHMEFPSQPHERVSTPPNRSIQGLGAVGQATNHDTTKSETKRPSKRPHDNDEATRTKKKTAASTSVTTYLTKGRSAISASHPTSDPTSSIDIAEVPEVKPMAFSGDGFLTAEFYSREYTARDWRNYHMYGQGFHPSASSILPDHLLDALPLKTEAEACRSDGGVAAGHGDQNRFRYEQELLSRHNGQPDVWATILDEQFEALPLEAKVEVRRSLDKVMAQNRFFFQPGRVQGHEY